MPLSERGIDLEKFSKENKDGNRIVSLAADLVLYIDPPFSEIGDAIRYAFDAFTRICPKERIRWYMSGTMTKHEPATARALGMLNTWLKPSAKVPDNRELELIDGDDPYSTAEHLFAVSWYSRGARYFESRVNWLRIMLPAALVEASPDLLLNLTVDLANHVPFLSGHAGYCLERSRYFETASADLAFPMLVRHPGLDFSVAHIVGRNLVRSHVKGVNWLTLLSPQFAQKIGGKKAFPASGGMSVLEAKNALIVKAGSAPQVGDLNRRDRVPEYKAVYDRIRPLLAPAYASFPLSEGAYEKTQKWYRRFDND